MASIRKRGGGYLIIVSMGYDHNGKRRPPQQKTVHPPEGLTQKQTDKWLQEQATLFEMTCKNITPKRNPNTTLAEYTETWLRDIAPTKLAKSTVIRERQDTERFLPVLGGYKLTELTADHFRKLYADMRRKKTRTQENRSPRRPSRVSTHVCVESFPTPWRAVLLTGARRGGPSNTQARSSSAPSLTRRRRRR